MNDSILGSNASDMFATDIRVATGCPSIPEFISGYNQGIYSIPNDAKAVDDPAPIYFNGSYYLMARSWVGIGDGAYVYKMDQNLNITSEFKLDLSAYLSKEEKVTQNDLVNINGQIFLITGVITGAPIDDYYGKIVAFPLSQDLSKVEGNVQTLIPGLNNSMNARVTRAMFANEKLYFNYILRSKNGGDDKGYIAVFNITGNNTFKKIDEIIYQEKIDGRHHSSFDILNEKIYIFFQTLEATIAVNVYEQI